MDRLEPLFRLSGAVSEDPLVEAWFSAPDQEMRRLAQPWFEAMCDCGDDVAQLLHDGHPTACVGGAAFGYVDAFTAHVNIGFFHGASLSDPSRLLEGGGKRMRHVKVGWGQPVETEALSRLINEAYRNIRARLGGVSTQ